MKKILISAIGMLAIVTVQEVKSQEHIPETDIYQTEERNDMMEKSGLKSPGCGNKTIPARRQPYWEYAEHSAAICRNSKSWRSRQVFGAVSDAPITREPAEHSRLESWLWVYTCLMKTRKQSLCPKSCSTISSRRMER